jgi:hypothetical protein
LLFDGFDGFDAIISSLKEGVPNPWVKSIAVTIGGSK